VLDIMASTIESANTGDPVVVESTVTVVPPLDESWDPRVATLTA
jgi:hypothetical protein